MGLIATLLPLLAAATAAGNACTPIAGLDEVLSTDAKYVVLGEIHGTVESPAIFADAVCQSAAHGPVTVALELPETDRASLDAFLASDGSPEARAAFLGLPTWNAPMKDGRTSEAFMAMIERLRTLVQAGRVRSVVPFQPVFGPDNGFSSARYEQRMADLIVRESSPDGRTLVLVGNSHARLTEVNFRDESYLPMAAHLPSDTTVTLYIVGNGGSSWNCQRGSDGEIACAEHPVGSPPRPFERSVELEPIMDGAYSGVLGIGGDYSASPPANP